MATGRVEGQTPKQRVWFHVFVAVAAKPRLWSTAVRQAGALAAPGWWRRRPFWPRPDPGYLQFRMETAYGKTHQATARDVVDYLEWCRGRL